jgi:tRNA (mo5U34)-methyltransferase
VTLQERVDALRWYHTIDLGGGVVTEGVDNTQVRLAQAHLPASFSGQSVLDIGAWDGFWSFEAERRGAARVVATDYYAWRGTGWGTGQGKAGFCLFSRRAVSPAESATGVGTRRGGH